MPSNDVYQLSVDQTIFGTSITNTHHFQQTSADAGANVADELMLAYQNQVETQQLLCQTADISLVQYRAIRVHPVPTQSRIITRGVPGTRPGGAHAANIVALGSMYTIPVTFAPGGLRVRVGKTFLSGMAKADIDAGVWDSVLRALLTAFIQALVNAITSPAGVTWQRVVFDTITGAASDLVEGEVRQASRKLRSRTRVT